MATTDITHLVRLDPRLAEHGISIPAFRLTVDDPDYEGDRWWRFAGKVQWEDVTPEFGISILLLDELEIPLDTGSLSFTKTIDANTNVVEGRNFRMKHVPAEVQLVLDLR